MRINREFGVLLTFTILFFAPLCAQNSINYFVQSETKAGFGSQSPFWMVNNQHGLATLESNNAYLRSGIAFESDSVHKIKCKAELDLVGLANYPSPFVIQQAFLNIQYRQWGLIIGSKEYNSILKNSTLSTGGLSWSGNARPIPQARFGLMQFVSFPWLFHNQFRFKGNFAFGRFSDDKFQRNRVSLPLNSYSDGALYHHKELVMSIVPSKSPLSYTAAIETEMQFGGQQHFLMPDGTWSITSSPSDLKHYLMAFVPSPGDKNSTASDQQYVYGNILGSIHLQMAYTKKDFVVKAYMENPFEDFSGMGKQNGFDGIWGIEYAHSSVKRGLQSFVFEYIQTTNQSGPIHYSPADYLNPGISYQATGADDYYNHNFYAGWQHWGMTCGNPLLTSPIYNDGTLSILNNRIKAIHIGATTIFSNRWSSVIRITASQNKGTHFRPFTEIKNNISTSAQLVYAPDNNNLSYSISSALDTGDTYNTNWGVSLGIKKVFD